jgi:PadR family transcriptional regulator PadR
MGQAWSDQKKGQELLLGTLDMLILQTLVVGAAHGRTVAHVIEHGSVDVLQIEQGSPYPALHRFEDHSWVCSYRGVSKKQQEGALLAAQCRRAQTA